MRDPQTIPFGDEARRKRGFTILEIMIATAILTLGLVGILALFPVAIHTGKQIVDTTTAAVVAKSVSEAIREGMRNSVRSIRRGNAVHAYFIFKHDGVEDSPPARREWERPDRDYYILLPRYRPGSEGRFANRDVAMSRAKTFLYPETDVPPNGNGDAFVADDDGDDQVYRIGSETIRDVRVEKVYRLGRFLPPEDAPRREDVLDDQKIDALKQYSFAFTVRSSHRDVSVSPVDQIYEPGNRLFHVRIMVFRGFLKPGPDDPSPTPVYELDLEVSL